MKMVDYVSGNCIVWPLLTLQVFVLMAVYGRKKVISDISFMIKRKLGWKIYNYWTSGWYIFVLASVAGLISFAIKSNAPIYRGIPVPNELFCKFKN